MARPLVANKSIDSGEVDGAATVRAIVSLESRCTLPYEPIELLHLGKVDGSDGKRGDGLVMTRLCLC